MVVGSIVLATEQGLGILAKAFYDNDVVHTVYVKPHSTRTNHYEWYPNRVKSVDELVDKCDIIILFETAFDWTVIPKARAKGKKTVLMVDYECTNYPLPYFPDLVICPSALDFDVYAELYKGHDIGYETRHPQIT